VLSLSLWVFITKENNMSPNILRRPIRLLFVLILIFANVGFSAPVSARTSRLDLSLPDLNAAYIARLPRFAYDAVPNQPAPGDPVRFKAHITNRGGRATGRFKYRWYIDGVPVASAIWASLRPGESAVLSLKWKWRTGAHKVQIQLDPGNLIDEVSERNNSVKDRTDALAVGFWVEQSVYDWFNLHQVELGIGSVSWDDWAQRQVKTWNRVFANSIHPLTPRGVLERVRLDKVTIIPDGTWQDCANGPSPEDKTVDLVWGFPSELVGVHSGRFCPPLNFYLNNPGFQNIEPALLHEMSHARYLVDLYGLNVYVHNVILSTGVNAAATSLVVDQFVETDGRFPLPAYLAVNGELIVCQSKSSNTFANCARGAEGTRARRHTAGTVVHLATVRVQDGQGNLAQGSPALPVIGDWRDHLYFNRYPDDMMSSTSLNYGQHSALAWNRILRRRPICGNANAPCNIGEYLNDIPGKNLLAIRGPDGAPLPDVRVDVFRARPFDSWYGRFFSKTPDATYFTNAQGRVNLGAQPFGSPIIHTYGHSNGLLLLKISADQQAVYRFFEVTEANEAYWSGHQQSATYPMIVSFQAPSSSLDRPDPTFGIGGKVTTDFSLRDDFSNGAALQPDGKIIVAGRASNGLDDDFGLVRYNGDGSLDPSFGTEGKVVTNLTLESLININTASVQELVTLPGIGPVLAQSIVDYRTANSPFETIQHLQNVPGMGPSIFNQIRDLITVGDNYAYAIALQPDGKIVVTGQSDSSLALARYNTDGSLDPSFDGDGSLLTDLDGLSAVVFSIVLQPDGKILVAGFRSAARDFSIFLARFNSDGSPDISFGTGGKVLNNFGKGEAYGGTLALQPDGKILLAGQTFILSVGYVFALARYNSDGTLDTSFGNNGNVTTDIEGSFDESIGEVIVLPDGRIIAAGSSMINEMGDFALIRYHADGSLDTTFGTGGKVITDVAGSDNFGSTAALQPDGRIVVAGGSFSGTNHDFALARYNGDGSLDASFDDDGIITTDFGVGDDMGNALLLQPDGKIVLAGSASTHTGYDFALARYGAGEAALEVTINIKPDNPTNHIAPRSRGPVRVAIYSTPEFNALTMIDISSLTFGPTGDEDSFVLCRKRGRDVNKDGLRDLICEFSIPATGFQRGDLVGILRGTTIDGTFITGSDFVKIGLDRKNK
jgi:competence ComEA-like helix-hairpin-helix protein